MIALGAGDVLDVMTKPISFEVLLARIRARRFWRADKVRSREAGGTGLGLTIAKQIAELHGAHLGAESEVGRGSVFTLRLPIDARGREVQRTPGCAVTAGAASAGRSRGCGNACGTRPERGRSFV